nr:MAG TPA: hypothetical protein [Caudoviricetes sp.]
MIEKLYLRVLHNLIIRVTTRNNLKNKFVLFLLWRLE